MVPMHLGLN